jgi:arsenate reductase (thioredoxin)
LAHRYLKTRISLFINLALKSLDQLTLGARRRETGQTEGAASRRPQVS